MCGLVGIAGTLNAPHERAFKTLLTLDALRGEHSTGVYAVARHADPLLMKKVGNPYELFETVVWDKAFKRQSMCLIGHNRYATVGVVNRENAHPFEFGHIVGAHNGTLHNKHEIPDGNAFNVDSQALYNSIANNGLKDTIAVAKGAWALTYWDKKDGSINFLRNKERPLWVAYTLDNKSVVWASEKWMIHVACSREQIPIQDPWEVDVDTHFSMVIPNVNSELPEFKEVGGVTGAPFHIHTNFTAGGTNQQQHGKVTPITDGKLIQKQILNGEKEVLSNQKGLTFLADSLHRDKSGNWYAECIHPKAAYEIRLYLKNEKEFAFIDGEYIRADVGPLYRGVDGAYYYKLNATTYTILSAEEAYQNRMQEEETVYKDKAGNTISKKEWEDKYSTCCWCTGLVDPTLGFKWAKYADETLCHICAEDEEVSGYLE